jgi:hypothetical protein
MIAGNKRPLDEAGSQRPAAVEWPILILIGALIPLGETVQHNGTVLLPSYAILAALLAVTI